MPHPEVVQLDLFGTTMPLGEADTRLHEEVCRLRAIEQQAVHTAILGRAWRNALDNALTPPLVMNHLHDRVWEELQKLLPCES